jgi:hypothetical protein
VRAAWQTQLTAARQTPGLLPALVRRRAELLPRFAAYYTHLRTLPRRVRRGLQRQWGLPLAGVALALALGPSPGLAATIPVRGSCTLVQAITAANTDTARGGCPAGSGADTLVLEPPGRTVTLTRVDNTTYGPTGLPVISSAITIAGNGGTIARPATAPAFRLLAVSATGELTLEGLTLTGGLASGDSDVSNSGGGVSNRGVVTISSSTISGNTATGLGGGVYNDAAVVTVTESTISGNTADNGGGIGNSAVGSLYYPPLPLATVTITKSTITGNTGAGVTSGNYAGGVTVTITESTITGNRSGGVATSAGGGDIRPFGRATLTISASTISGNTGAGVSFDSSYGGQGTATISASTITGNTASAEGGGIMNSSAYGGQFTVTLAHSLVAGNRAPSAPEIVNRDGTITANAFNLFGVNGSAGVVGFRPGARDVVPRAGVQLRHILNPTLANNGGPTRTHALVPGSPALNAGDRACTDATGVPLRRDQRGVLRPQEGVCDIGAFEFLPVVLCGGRPATLVGSATADFLFGTPGTDVIHGRGGNDVLEGRGGNDMLCGGPGHDTLRGGFGQDQLDGGPGTDVCDGGAGTDMHAGGCEVLHNVP